MIGDWVLCNDKPYRINQIGDILCMENEEKSWLAPPEDVSPIPLTPEILEKNGFESTLAPGERVCKNNGYEVWLDNEGGNHWVSIKKGEFYFEGYIKSVHELQHALRLCGIEKEIVL